MNTLSQLRQEQTIEEKLWHHGKEVGSLRGKVVFYNLPFLQQMKIGVLSDSGITFATRPVLAAADVKLNQVKKNPKLQKFITAKEKIIKHDLHEKRLDFPEIFGACKEILALLRDSDKASMISFIYSNDQEMMQAQIHFIALGKHVL